MNYSFYRSDSIDWTTQDCVNAVQDWLSIARGDFNRYPADAIYKALNNGAARFTLLTECLTMPVLIVAQANMQHYRLPDCVQKIQSGRYYYGSDRYSYQELTIKGSMRELQDEVLDWRGAQGSPAYYLVPSYRAGNIVQFAISMFPSTAGTSFSATNSGVLAFNAGTTWPGAATGANLTAGASYIDSLGRDMTTLGVTVGLPIFNITNTNYLFGFITGITTTNAANDTLTASMGTNWAVSDKAVIPLPDWGLAIDIPAGTLNTICSATGTVGDLTAFTDNMILDVVRKPFPMLSTMPSFVPEMPSDYVEAAVAYAVYQIGRAAFKGLIQKEKSEEGKQRFSELIEQYRELSPFADQSEMAIGYFDYFS